MIIRRLITRMDGNFQIPVRLSYSCRFRTNRKIQELCLMLFFLSNCPYSMDNSRDISEQSEDDIYPKMFPDANLKEDS